MENWSETETGKGWEIWHRGKKRKHGEREQGRWKRNLLKEQRRQRGDSNPCGQSPMDFESISLAARTHCHMSCINIAEWSKDFNLSLVSSLLLFKCCFRFRISDLMSLPLSLSLSIYISSLSLSLYIYICIYTQFFTRNPICWVPGRNSGV